MDSIEVKLNEALAKIKILETENTQLKEAVTTSKVATAKAERASQLKESKLPEPCVKRIDEAFGKSTDNAGLKEAINVENEYIKSLKVVTKHNGAGDNGTVEESEAKTLEFKERQFKAYRASGISIEEASSLSGHTPKK